jgi:hypothetical protein
MIPPQEGESKTRNEQFVAAARAGQPLPDPYVKPIEEPCTGIYTGYLGTQGTQGIERDLMGLKGVASATVSTSPEEKTLEEKTQEYAHWVDPAQPLDAYAREAVEVVMAAKEDGWIFDWHSGVFHVVRYLKAHPQAAKMKPMALIRWLDKRRVDWMPDPDGDRDEAEAEFVRHWDKIRFLPGESPIEAAHTRAKLEPFGLSPEVLENRPEKYAEFLNLVAWLVVTIGRPEVALPCERIGDVLDVTKMTVSTYRQFAIEDQYLTLVSPHRRPGKGTKGAATVYRLAVERLESVRKLLGGQQ